MGFLKSVRERGLLWALTNTGLYFFDKWVELGLFPNMLHRFGEVAGTAIMIVFSFAICVLFLYLYDNLSSTKWRDALGLETVKEAGNEFRRAFFRRTQVTPPTNVITTLRHIQLRSWEWVRRPVARLLISRARVRVALFFWTSCANDPMTTTILLRPLNYHTMGRKEWSILVASTVVSNVWWALVVSIILEVIERYTPWVLPWLGTLDPVNWFVWVRDASALLSGLT